MLRNRGWGIRYTTDDTDMITALYVPALADAVKYDYGTAYFRADSLSLATRGIEGLVKNNGKMRLLVGCTLNGAEVNAIRRGEELREQVEKNLCSIPLDISGVGVTDSLELLAWMIAADHLDVKVAVMNDAKGMPTSGTAIYHKKLGAARDASGDGIAWRGSGNFTIQGLSGNSESMSVFTSWRDPERCSDVEEEFEMDWSGKNPRLSVMVVPEAVRQKLLGYAPPPDELPKRLVEYNALREPNAIWSYVWHAHNARNGQMVGPATAPVVPWPHQMQVFGRLHGTRPAKLLIADEVGLGKTIQAGLFLRQAWLEGRRRILVMAPAGLTHQWQVELREKLNLDWPIYDGKSLVWPSTHFNIERKESPGDWTARGPVIVSSHLARREVRARDILNAEWDVVVLDEAHYARQTNPTNPDKHTPNNMLHMMRQLQDKTDDLLLLTATPMQIHPVELYDLLGLLGLPDEWSWSNFERFYRMIRNISHNDIPFASMMYRTSVKKYGPVDASGLNLNKLRSDKILRILGGDHTAKPLSADYQIMRDILLLCSPVTRLVSRNTRKRLRHHILEHDLGWRLGTRNVKDVFVPLSTRERAVYDDVNRYISQIWNSYMGTNRQAVGFALTVYRKRLASSFAALRNTLENHLERLQGGGSPHTTYEDEYDDMDADEISYHEEAALKDLDRKAVLNILNMVRALPPDTKLEYLVDTIASLRNDGYAQAMVFTQFTDTMDYLRDNLGSRWRVMCYSGRGGEVQDPKGVWTGLGRDEAKAKFRDGAVDVLVCTDAAAEGLNFQFCGAMINYDMPWNPMRVEQRIGRIDRIGQRYDSIRVTNMYYKDTVEADVYGALRDRIRLFEDVVGPLQPILDEDVMGYAQDGERIASKMSETLSDSSIDLDSMLAPNAADAGPPESPVTMEDLDRIMSNGRIMGRYKPEYAGPGQYNVTLPSGRKVRITTDIEQFERHSDSMEFWSPGSPAFPEPATQYDPPGHATLKRLLDSIE